ncbi:MAG TPA: RtcB family protein [Verrucomicrobiae bacterium]|jgi:tRNA-splicing ligase RtcB|nr:RtcB family protein [Verrucomicrobiae bacterium]
MRVPGLVLADDRLMAAIQRDASLEQVANGACLPGIVSASLAMPDIHQGYGLPVGGVVATDPAEGGVVSPGGVGYDINCGVRLMRTRLLAAEVAPRLESLLDALHAAVPAGVGARGRVTLSAAELRRVAERGAGWAGGHDLARVESHGRLEGGDADALSEQARERGRGQLGSLGSGNHFLEIQKVDEVYDAPAAQALGLAAGAMTVMIHTGSRGLGHQACTDALRRCEAGMRRFGISLPDRQLACAPLESPEAGEYLAAMRAAANFAFANRQVLAEAAEEAFLRALGVGPSELGWSLVYDVAHNIAKEETHVVDGVRRRLLVHRKGATRAFPPNHPELPPDYRALGQPVLIPGDMGRYSFVLLGTEAAMRETFGSTCHGAGRLMSRTAAVKAARGRRIRDELSAAGVSSRATGRHALEEEMPEAYKDVQDVVNVVVGAGISRKVARLRPIGVVKG